MVKLALLHRFRDITPPLPGGFGWGNKYTSLSELDETLLPGILDHSKTLFFYGEIGVNVPFSRYTPPTHQAWGRALGTRIFEWGRNVFNGLGLISQFRPNLT